MRTDPVLEATLYKDHQQYIDSQIAECKALLQGFSNNDMDIDQYILGSDAANKSERETFELDEQAHLNASSFATPTGPTVVDSDLLLPKFASNIASGHIKEDCLPQTKEFVDEPQTSSQIRVYLQLPSTQTEKFHIFHSNLERLFDRNLVVIPDGEKPKANDLSIIVQSLSTDDDKLVLEKICSLGTSISLYLLGTEPDTINTRQQFFTKYRQVCAILDDPEELAVKIALDVALKSRKMGDRYTRSKDKDCANQMYDQCIGLLNQLSILTLKNTNNKD